MTTDEVQVRATHPYGFRYGQWATILGIVWANERPCYKVIFPDATVDLWVVQDSWDSYEFRKIETIPLEH